jgi:hypothetical protein
VKKRNLRILSEKKPKQEPWEEKDEKIEGSRNQGTDQRVASHGFSGGLECVFYKAKPGKKVRNNTARKENKDTDIEKRR